MNATRMALPFHIVDVFAVEPLTGNPLAVVDGGADLTLDLFQRIAREFNQSETTFVLPPTRPGADWLLRSFTAAGSEVVGPGGHNSLGAWWWLAAAGRLALTGGVTLFHQEIGDSVLPVTITRAGDELTGVVMDQKPPRAGRRAGHLHSSCGGIRRERELTEAALFLLAVSPMLPEDRCDFHVLTPFGPRERRRPRFIV